nr:hypothetical protein CFP56_26144 [Quercus suber]
MLAPGCFGEFKTSLSGVISYVNTILQRSCIVISHQYADAYDVQVMDQSNCWRAPTHVPSCGGTPAEMVQMGWFFPCSKIMFRLVSISSRGVEDLFLGIGKEGSLATSCAD